MIKTRLSIEDRILIEKLLRQNYKLKDIAIDNGASPNTVKRVMDSYYNSIKIYKHYLPPILSFDEFKSVKSIDGETGKIIDIIEDRKLNSLLNYFSKYLHKARYKIKLIIIDYVLCSQTLK